MLWVFDPENSKKKKSVPPPVLLRAPTFFFESLSHHDSHSINDSSSSSITREREPEQVLRVPLCRAARHRQRHPQRARSRRPRLEESARVVGAKETDAPLTPHRTTPNKAPGGREGVFFTPIVYKRSFQDEIEKRCPFDAVSARGPRPSRRSTTGARRNISHPANYCLFEVNV